jgi:hypothetical protein
LWSDNWSALRHAPPLGVGLLLRQEIHNQRCRGSGVLVHNPVARAGHDTHGDIRRHAMKRIDLCALLSTAFWLKLTQNAINGLSVVLDQLSSPVRQSLRLIGDDAGAP